MLFRWPQYALRYLHSINNIFRDFKADNVLLWSLSLDHLINCKVADFSIITHVDPGGSRSLHGTKGFIAPEVAHVKEHSVYNHKADIFSFGMFLYQLIARRHPFHNLHPYEIEAAIEEGRLPQLNNVSLADSCLCYITRIMKLYLAGDPTERPTSQQIVKWLSAPAVQLIISVVPVKSRYSIRNGSIVSPVTPYDIGPELISSELWICCGGKEGSEVNIFNTNTIEEVCRHPVKENLIQCIKQCSQYVWVPSRTDLEFGVVSIFSENTKDLVDRLELKENAVSCITNSDQLVYLGTMGGNCFLFPH